MKKATVSKPRTKKVEHALQSGQESIGLCSCCNSHQTCTFRRNDGDPILQCEEFDGMIPSRLKVVSRRKPLKMSFPTGDSDLLPGLCGVCEDRTACTYPKPEGGVWHCEEYR